jgi:DNA-binding GntR family transcriptional regulator
MTVAGAVAQADIRAAPVARDTLQERVYNRLASLILDGDIPPGRLVTIQSLAEAFGVSAMPVREALKRLTASNALTVVSGRSIGVPPITLERFTDLRNVRREIEGAATAWAANASTPTLSHRSITTLRAWIRRSHRARRQPI